MLNRTESEEMSFKFAKAIIAIIVLPGMVGFVIPFWLSPRSLATGPAHWLGVPVFALGIFILLWCVRDFYVTGKGTLAP